jgi:hypothetical protein
LSHPGQVGRGTLLVLGVHLWGAPQIVVAAYDVKGDEQHVALSPAHVFAKLGVSGVFALARQPHGAPAEALIALEEHLAELCQPLERVVRARPCPVTVGPLVVSGNEYEGMSGILGKIQTMLECLVAARRVAPELLGPRRAVVPEVAVVNDKGQLGGVQFLHDIGKLPFVPGVERIVTMP